jgi:CoA:oxalate CoA-transferase
MTQPPANPLPLAGVTVVEFCQALAGPYCAAILADLGARVIKVEKPGGDDSRSMPPHFIGDSSAYYMGPNRTKESIVIDLKRPHGRELALALAAGADIVVENNRPGVMDRLGLGFEAVKAVNPKVVYCAITGFGQTGPYRDLPAYDSIVQAMSGVMSLTGEPGRKAVRAGVPIGDLCAGMNAALGAVAALRTAEATGAAQYVDISMLDTQVSLMSYHLIYYMFSGVVSERKANGHTGVPELGEYECADGKSILVSPMGEQMWPQLCAALDRPDLAADETLKRRVDRVKKSDAVRAELAATYRLRPAAEWIGRLRERGVPVTTINTVDMVVADPQVQHRGMLQPVDYQGHPVTLIGSAIKIDGVDMPLRAPPELGADTRRILGDQLGLSDAEIAGYIDSGAIGAPAATPAEG